MNVPLAAGLVGHKSPVGCGTRGFQLADGMTDLSALPSSVQRLLLLLTLRNYFNLFLPSSRFSYSIPEG